jgi:hypothetical protein
VAGLGALALSVSCGSERSPFRPLGGSAGAVAGTAGSGAANAGMAGRGGSLAGGGQGNQGGSSGANAGSSGSGGSKGGKGGNGGASGGTGGKGDPMGGVGGDGGEAAGTAGGSGSDAGRAGRGGSDGGSGGTASTGTEFRACLADGGITRLTIQRVDEAAMTCVVMGLEQGVGGGCPLGLTSDGWCFARAQAFDTAACSGNGTIASAASGTFSVSIVTLTVALDVTLEFSNGSPVGEELTVELENCLADCSGEDCRSP